MNMTRVNSRKKVENFNIPKRQYYLKRETKKNFKERDKAYTVSTHYFLILSDFFHFQLTNSMGISFFSLVIYFTKKIKNSLAVIQNTTTDRFTSYEINNI